MGNMQRANISAGASRSTQHSNEHQSLREPRSDRLEIATEGPPNHGTEPTPFVSRRSVDADVDMGRAPEAGPRSRDAKRPARQRVVQKEAAEFSLVVTPVLVLDRAR